MKKIDDEEIIEMQSDEKGTYYPVAIIKVLKGQKNPPSARAALHFQKYIPAFYEVIDGFVMGLGAIENFIMNMKKLDGRIKQ
jgi:hypothetical protein